MPGRLAERLAPQLADGGDDGARGRFGDAGGPHHDDARLALGGGIVDPVIDAAAAQRLVQVARPVRGQHDDRMLGGAQRAALGNGNLEVGEEFEQERLELLVGAVDFVDQQHGRVRRAQGREHRPLDQERLAIDIDALFAGLADRQHLARIVPLVERGRRRRCPRSIAGGSACGRARRQSPWRLRSCRRRARLPAAAACRARARDRMRSQWPSSAR